MTSSQVEPAGSVAPGATLAAVRAIRPILMEHRMWADEHARMAPAVKEAAQKAGVFMMMAPHEYGGGEVALPEIGAVFEELGYADPTVAWHAGNSGAIATCGWRLDPAAAAPVFAGAPGPFGFSTVAAGRATPEPGGFRLAGAWPFMTGALDAEWASLIGIVRGERKEGQGPDFRQFLVPAKDLVIEPTWQNASAMRGTGSHAVRVEDAFVPQELALRFDDSPRMERPSQRLPAGTGGPFAIASMAVGLTRRALDEATGWAAAKVSRGDGVAYRDRTGMQRTVGEAHAAIDALSAGMAAAAEHAWSHALAGPIPATARGRLWGTAFWTLDQCRTQMSNILTISTSAVYSGRNPIETALRDLHAMAAALEASRGLQEDFGKLFFGLEPTTLNF